MSHRDESRYLADEVDLGNGVFAEVVYTFSYEVSGEGMSDIDILSVDDMKFRKIIGPDGETLPLVVTREYENAARQEFWKIFVDSAERGIEDKIRSGEITLDG